MTVCGSRYPPELVATRDVTTHTHTYVYTHTHTHGHTLLDTRTENTLGPDGDVVTSTVSKILNLTHLVNLLKIKLYFGKGNVNLLAPKIKVCTQRGDLRLVGPLGKGNFR